MRHIISILMENETGALSRAVSYTHLTLPTTIELW